MNILITGASGLIGTALTEKLFLDGHDIIGLSRTSRSGDDKIQWVQHDLYYDPISNLKIPYDIHVAYHLAGQTSTYAAKEDPIEDININVLGFLNLLEFFRKNKSKTFVVHAGTATEVGLTDKLPIHEGISDRPVTFYDISKLTAELYLKQYIREGWISGCTLRLSNVFGKSNEAQQRDRGIIDKVFVSAVSGQNITIYGDGNYLRDYIFIDDVISAFVLAAKHQNKINGGTFYIGSGQGISLKDAFLKVISLAMEITGRKVDCKHVEPPEGLSDIEYRNAIVDSSLFSRLTGWNLQFNFASGLRATYLKDAKK